MTTEKDNLQAIRDWLYSQLQSRGVPIDSIGDDIGLGACKVVFECVVGGVVEALKVTCVPSFKNHGTTGIDPTELKRRTGYEFSAIQALNELDVPTVVRLGQINPMLELHDVDGTTYMVWSEKRLAMSVEEIIKSGGYCRTVQELRRILACGAISLDALQQLQMVHRDLKPGNFCADGSIFTLTDFGLVYHRGRVRHTLLPLGTYGINIPVEVLSLNFAKEHKYQMDVLLGSDYDLYGLGQTAFLYSTRCWNEILPGSLAHHRPDFEGTVECTLVDELRMENRGLRCTLDRLKDELWDECAQIVQHTKFKLNEPLVRQRRRR